MINICRVFVPRLQNDANDLFIRHFLYTDDTKILGQISVHKVLQFDINRAIEQSVSNKLSFNYSKFSILEFSYKNTYDSSAELFAIGIAIKKEKQIKHLGINFTSSLNLNCHLDFTIMKEFQKLNHLKIVIPRTTEEFVNFG